MYIALMGQWNDRIFGNFLLKRRNELGEGGVHFCQRLGKFLIAQKRKMLRRPHFAAFNIFLFEKFLDNSNSMLLHIIFEIFTFSQSDVSNSE